jgi:hypothetical protein
MNYVIQETEQLINAINALPDPYRKELSKRIDGLVLAANSQNGAVRKYAEQVKVCRNVQKEYFSAAKAKDWVQASLIKKEAIRLEKELDKDTEELIQGAKQITLF